MSAWDTIVVGAGSSGCLAAARLVAETGDRVLLLEAGGPYRNPLLRIAAGYMKFLASDRYLTMVRSLPEPGLGGRAPIIPQARILGGGSSVNAMVYMRGQPADYDAWSKITGADWGWNAMLPHFARLEDNDRLGPPLHGIGGPLKVSDNAHVHEMSRAFVAAVAALGVPESSDFNGGKQAGVGLMQVTAREGWRCGAVEAFLRPLGRHPRLSVRLHARVDRLIFDGERAAGVVLEGEEVRARRIILAAGAFNTPKLLMLSGIGPEDILPRQGIDLRVDSAGVGANLMDHLEAPVVYATRRRDGYWGEDRGWRMFRNGMQFIVGLKGPAATIGVEACAFWPEPDDTDAALQIYCVPTVYLDRDVTGVAPASGLTLNACLLRPRSRGRVSLSSSDPAAPPRVETGYLREDADMQELLRGLSICRDIARTEPLAGRLAKEILPGSTVTEEVVLCDHVRKTVKTNYHPCGTVRMGRVDDDLAPLGPDGAVKGVNGLWVVDASAMPTIPSANTNAPVMAMADRIMDGVLGVR